MGKTVSHLIEMPFAKNAVIKSIKHGIVSYDLKEKPVSADELNTHTLESWAEKLRLEDVSKLKTVKFHPIAARLLASLDPDIRKKFDRREGPDYSYSRNDFNGDQVSYDDICKFVITTDGKCPVIDFKNTKFQQNQFRAEGNFAKTILDGLMGQPARKIVDHPLFDDYIISRYNENSKNTVFTIKPQNPIAKITIDQIPVRS